MAELWQLVWKRTLSILILLQARLMGNKHPQPHSCWQLLTAVLKIAKNYNNNNKKNGKNLFANFFGGSIWTSMQNLKPLAQKMAELWQLVQKRTLSYIYLNLSILLCLQVILQSKSVELAYYYYYYYKLSEQRPTPVYQQLNNVKI